MTTKENLTNWYIQTKLTEIIKNADCEGKKMYSYTSPSTSGVREEGFRDVNNP